MTVNGLGNRKNEAVQRRIRTEGVRVFEGSRRYLQAAEKAGLRRAVVSSSANTREVLDVTGLAQYIEQLVDGVTIRTDGLKGKPAPDTFLAAAKGFGVDPSAGGGLRGRTRRSGRRPAGQFRATWSASTASAKRMN